MKSGQYLRQRLRLRLRKRLSLLLYSNLYRDNQGDTAKSIMVAGTGRSGTTWLADVIRSQIPVRIMFEPFHSGKVPAYSQFHYFEYMRPDVECGTLHTYCQRVFSGAIRNKWIDREVDLILPKFRIIKEIRANGFLKWIFRHFPEVPQLLIIRHPCAVVLSRMQLDWATDTDIEPFLTQSEFVEDFLSDKMEIIKGAKSAEAKHAIIWCLSNLVPLRQFQPGEIQVVFYENLCLQPAVEIARIFGVIKHEYRPTVLADAGKPSRTVTSSSAVLRGEDKVRRWQKELSPGQINTILSVAADFGLDYLYGDSPTPIVASDQVIG
jgi:hypothetical protein